MNKTQKALKECHAHTIRPEHLSFLLYVHDNQSNKWSITDYKRNLYANHSTVTVSNWCQHLDSLGYIVSEIVPTNRRIKLPKITNKGIRLLQDLNWT
jgi:DNA-binding MarR family transcriptional regulator